MNANDFLLLVHPIFAVAVVFPLIGMVVRMAWQTRQRRLIVATGSKSQIPAGVGKEHVDLGRWLSGSVVVLSLIGLAHPIGSKMLEHQTWTTELFRTIFVLIIFVATSSSLFFLYRSTEKMWRGIFATLTGMGLVILGSQPEIYRRESEWYISHYYYGIIAAMLMIFSLAIIQDIYQDRRNRWRNVHIILNCLALLLFIGQGFTGTRDLLEIPISWQKPYVESLYEYQCDKQNCLIQPPTLPSIPK
jgi:Protein of unknown function (DUF4079)